MFNLGALDLVIGLFFIYFVLSVVCTSIVEGIAQMKNLRSVHLNQWISDTFTNVLGAKILNHKLIKGLTQESRDADYIPAQVFSTVILDLVHDAFQDSRQKPEENRVNTYDFDRVEAALSSPTNPLPQDINRFLLQALEESKNAGGSLMLIKKRLEGWYEEAMQRIIGTYKKRTRFITWIAAVLVTLCTNADTVALSKYLKSNPEVTRNLVEAAQQTTKDSLLFKKYLQLDASIQRALQNDSTNTDAVKKLERDSLRKEIAETITAFRKAREFNNTLYSSLYTTGLPLGWEHGIPPYKDNLDGSKEAWFYIKWGLGKLVGLLITALALTLGAPFWFDTINKLVNIRSSGNKPEDSSKNKTTTPVG
jgi:hypothetical protein